MGKVRGLATSIPLDSVDRIIDREFAANITHSSTRSYGVSGCVLYECKQGKQLTPVYDGRLYALSLRQYNATRTGYY